MAGSVTRMAGSRYDVVFLGWPAKCSMLAGPPTLFYHVTTTSDCPCVLHDDHIDFFNCSSTGLAQ